MPQTITPLAILTTDGKHNEREQDPECTAEVRIHAADLAERVSRLLDHLGIRTSVTSGFRTTAANSAANGAKNSAHLTGEAVDLADTNRTISTALNAHPELLVQFDLYMENSYYTATWCHLQIRPILSGRRVFTP